VVLGVSMDGEDSHKKFCDDQKLPFDLLVDAEKKIHAAYGFKGMVRALILIDASGVIRFVNKEFKLKDEQWETLFKEVKALHDEGEKKK
jgi:peroxiredoxin